MDEPQTAYRHTVRVLEAQSVGMPDNATIQTADGVAFTLESGDLGFIQNLGTVPIAVKYGSDAASDSMHGVLKACLTNMDGSGARANFSNYIGPVSVAGIGGTPKFLAWKRKLY